MKIQIREEFMESKYKRALIKLSGEALSGDLGHGIDFETAAEVCRNIVASKKCGAQIAIVCGAGNFWRGRQGSDMDPVKADHMGMLATNMNALALAEQFRLLGEEAKVLSAIAMPQICETYTKDLADKYLNEGKIVIFGGGTGCPFFTTDTAAALRAVEIGADVALMAKNIDGVYDKDPRRNPDAKKFDRITYGEILDRKLGVIDLTAASLCMGKGINVLLFRLGKGETIADALCGSDVGTVLYE